MSSLLTLTGSVLILHAAYSCLHYRFVVQDLEASANGLLAGMSTDTAAAALSAATTTTAIIQIPPTDVWMECCAAFLLVLLGELSRKGSHLQPVVPRRSKDDKSSLKNKPLMAPVYRTRDFDVYTTRGCAL